MAELFGEVAGDYDEIRPGYPAALAATILAYHGGPPTRLVEVGAGTGLATALLRDLAAAAGPARPASGVVGPGVVGSGSTGPSRPGPVGAGRTDVDRAAPGRTRVTCVEPDARMAAVLAARFPDVEVVVARFEQWSPPRPACPCCRARWPGTGSTRPPATGGPTTR
ncbi:hypothetical protein AB0K25_09810 [Micromonospora sp. NPDC049257]|uniref:hypothetical protein n=1 Tax=Micromonospora sp. NPDC049257 TaxID=3155771 RepID=UPI0034335172